ncbi:hypothetical protein J0H58_37815 [bacterium]|nr:hypothetical protein [bacterium]
MTDAKSWHRHLSLADQDKYTGARYLLKVATALLALYKRDLRALPSCREHGPGHEDVSLRVHLLLRDKSRTALDDPADLSHPARRAARFPRTQNVHTRYHYLLALVDYRLACLRFTTGLPAVDDLYYRKPDKIPQRIMLAEPEKFRVQLRAFDRSCRMLERHARHLDGLLKCSWRTEEALTRRQRCAAIAAACDTAKV